MGFGFGGFSYKNLFLLNHFFLLFFGLELLLDSRLLVRGLGLFLAFILEFQLFSPYLRLLFSWLERQLVFLKEMDGDVFNIQFFL
jgi:hypothetical protein